MEQSSAGHDAYVESRVEKILSGADWNEERRTAVLELFEFLCANPRQSVPSTHPGQCAIAIDSGNECIVEIAIHYLPDDLRARTSVAAYDDLVDVVRMVKDTAPEVLAIISNLLIRSGVEGIAACVAVSPSTRYLILTGWHEEAIRDLCTRLAPLQVPIDVLPMPFNRQQLRAALRIGM